jgi:hypothetical protein
VSNPFPEIPDELLSQLGYANRGWAHLTMVASHRLPTDLQRANRVRRGALLFLSAPKKQRH